MPVYDMVIFWSKNMYLPAHTSDFRNLRTQQSGSSGSATTRNCARTEGTSGATRSQVDAPPQSYFQTSNTFTRAYKPLTYAFTETCFVHKHSLCDGVDDCSDGADESMEICKKRSEKTCQRRYRREEEEHLTLPVQWLCDGQVCTMF